MDVNEIDVVKNHSFAVVQLRPGTETQLLKILLENGYTNVSFANAQGEMVKMMDEDRGDHLRQESVIRSSTSSSSRGEDEVEEEEDDEDEDRLAATEELLNADEDVVNVDVDDTDVDEMEQVKENREDALIIDEGRQSQLMMIKEKEKELLESFYSQKSISPIDTPPESIDSPQRKLFLEQIKEQQLQAINKLEPHSPGEFSSLTLPTVLWGANAAAAAAAAANTNATGGDPTPAKLPPGAAFPYPFLSAAVNPFLQYLPSNPDHASVINALKGAGEMGAGYPFPGTAGTAATTEALAAALWSRHHHHHQSSQLLDTPPATPRQHGLVTSPGDAHCLINGAKLRQRGRQLRRHERDSSAYASCRLCRNRILANRLSNLHNHVRRHAVLKQFHCCYCSYAHTEVAKVRLHMLHNHKDDRSQPLDKRNDDMEAAWAMLMRECFPGYA